MRYAILACLMTLMAAPATKPTTNPISLSAAADQFKYQMPEKRCSEIIGRAPDSEDVDGEGTGWLSWREVTDKGRVELLVRVEYGLYTRHRLRKANG